MKKFFKIIVKLFKYILILIVVVILGFVALIVWDKSVSSKDTYLDCDKNGRPDYLLTDNKIITSHTSMTLEDEVLFKVPEMEFEKIFESDRFYVFRYDTISIGKNAFAYIVLDRNSLTIYFKSYDKGQKIPKSFENIIKTITVGSSVYQCSILEMDKPKL